MRLEDVQRAESVIFAFDMSPVAAVFCQKFGIQESEAERYSRELKRYFLLRYAQKRRYGMMGKIDDLWHEFILNTELYSEFCDKAFGTYLHHKPSHEEETRDPEKALMYVRFLIDYFRYFGSPPPNDIWPLSVELFGDVEDWRIEQAHCIGPCFT